MLSLPPQFRAIYTQGSTYWAANRKWLLPLLLVLSLLGAFGAGRYATPDKVVTKDRIVEVVREKAVQVEKVVEKVVEKKVYVQVKRRVRNRLITTQKKPDGTVTIVVDEREKEETDTKTETDKNKIVYVDKIVTVEKEVEKIVEREKLVQGAKANWRLGPMVGLDVMYWFDGKPLIPQLGPFVLGLEVERRIVGPFSLGIWATTNANVGIVGNLEW